MFNIKSKKLSIVTSLAVALLLPACQQKTHITSTLVVEQSSRTSVDTGRLSLGVYRLTIKAMVKGAYGVLSIYAGEQLLSHNLNLPKTGENEVNTLINVNEAKLSQLSFEVKDSDIEIIEITIEPVEDLVLPSYVDRSSEVGLDKVNSIKYGGPTVADMDMDGDYDFIVNNHNAESSKLYWNNGDNTISKHPKNLARWFMHDLHGTAAGDYDNDGDLDLVVTMGGGNGKNPSKANFYLNDNGNFVLYTGDVGINKGGRGRGARWIDADMDGDLDLLLHNEASLTKSKPQQYFYNNLGNGKFERKDVAGLQDVTSSRVLITDVNNDQIDDIVFYGHHGTSIWKGNGDFSYTDISKSLPENVRGFNNVMAIVDVDIDNDGDLDLYLARGKEFGNGKNVSMDFDAIAKELDIKPKGRFGQENLSFTSQGNLEFYNYHYQAQMGFRNKIYPMFLGENKTLVSVENGAETVIDPDVAMGFPSDLSESGMYFGVTGKNQQGEYIWQAALVRKANIFWGFGFSLRGITSVTPDFKLENRNVSDLLLANNNGQYVDVSKQWNIPQGGNSLGVTRGDFNNDGKQDLFVYRWGRIGKRIADLMLLNNAHASFDNFTLHGANHIGGPGNGDMGQAFDFDLDGKLDLLNGSEGGQWYVYGNQSETDYNHLTVRVGYSPNNNIDAYGAVVKVAIGETEYLQRVGSSGEVFSQSLLNNVHFGLAEEDDIKSVKVTWRNGEEYEFSDVEVNSLIETPQSTWFKQTKLSADKPADKALTKPYVRFINAEQLQQQGLTVGDEVTLIAEYHAGSGRKVIAADEGGVRFWLRHFKYKWIPAKDIKVTDSSVLYTEKGTTSATISLADLVPSDELPEGHFYQLRVSFMSSSGEMIDDTIDYVKVKGQ